MTIITFTDFETGTIHRVEVPYTFQEMRDRFTRPQPDPYIYVKPAVLALPIPPTPAYFRRKARRTKVDDPGGNRAMVVLALFVGFILLLCLWILFSFIASGG